MTVTAAPRVTTPERRALLAKVHIARKDLALHEDSYRAVLERITGRPSASAATDRQLADVIAEFRRLGWSGGPRGGRGAPSARQAEQAGKLRALWLSLYNLGEVQRRDDDALTAFICRHTGKQTFRWNSPGDLQLATEHLKAWCARVGYVPRRQEPIPYAAGVPLEGRYEAALIDAQWHRLYELGAFRTLARFDTWLHNRGFKVSASIWLTVDQAQAAIAELGQWLRRVKRQRGGDGAA